MLLLSSSNLKQTSKKNIRLMDKSLHKNTQKDIKSKQNHQVTTSKTKKQLLHNSSSKHLKKNSMSKIKQPTQTTRNFQKSPQNTYHLDKFSNNNQNSSNDYCVNQYYVKYKLKSNRKNQQKHKQDQQNQGYNSSKRHKNKTASIQIQTLNQEYGTDIKLPSDLEQNHSYYKVSNMMKKIKFPEHMSGGVINSEGKYVSMKNKNEGSKKSNGNSFQDRSSSQHTLSYSTNYLTKNERNKKYTKSKSKSKNKKSSKSKQKSFQLKNSHKKSKSIDKDLLTNESQKFKIKKLADYQMNLNKKSKQKLERPNIHKMNQDYSNSKKQSFNNSKQIQKPLRKSLIRGEQFYKQMKQLALCTPEQTSSQISKVTMTDLTQVTIQIQNESYMSVKKQKQFRSVLSSLNSGINHLQRAKCIDLLGKICYQLHTKRQAHSLAIFYLDKFIHSFKYSNIKIVSLSSLLLALKIQDPEVLPKFCNTFPPNPQATIKKSSSKGSLKKKSQTSSTISKNQQKQVNQKIINFINSPIFEEQQQKKQNFHIGQILDMESHIMCKLKYKFYVKTLTYWVDLLTDLWDKFLIDQNINEDLYIFFRHTLQFKSIKSHKQFKILSFLIQVTEAVQYNVDFYKYNGAILVLSTMYLLIRLQIQQVKTLQPLGVYRSYRQNLGKSANIIFCDQSGINQIFGNFLAVINLSLANIIECVQYISKYIIPQKLKIINYRDIQGNTYQDKLSNYTYNQELLKMFLDSQIW